MLRFYAYILEKDGQIVPFDVPNNMMTGSVIKEERIEFEKLIKINEYAKENIKEKERSNYAESICSSETKQQESQK